MTQFVVGVRVDGNAAGLAKAAAEAKKVLDSLATAGVSGASSTARAQAQAAAAMRRDYQAMAQAREMLGIRSERRIQQEIRATEAAYQRLARSGTLSWNEQQRAVAAMRKQVRELTNEMGRMTGGQRLVAVGRGAGLAVAGVAAGAAVVAPKVQQAMSYEYRLAHMANTAFNERSTPGRIAGMKELDAQVREATRYGGGTVDNAATALEQLLAAGAFGEKDVGKVFREAVMAGTANKAAAVDFVNLAVKAKDTMGIAPERMGALFGIGTYAGQQGQFEIGNMARHLPRQMGSATQLGLYGEAGFAKLAAVNQAAMKTAGSPDEAGINVANLVAKMSSQDTQKQFKKQFGIDLPKLYAEGRVRGLDAFDVLGGILDKQLSKDKNYQAVQRQLRDSKNAEEHRAALQAVGNIAQGTVVGKGFQDQQALMALVGFLQDRKRVAEIAEGSLKNTDAAEKNMQTLRSTAAFSAEQASNVAMIANVDAMNKLTPAVKAATDALVAFAQANPGAAAAASGAMTIGSGIATAAGTMALGKMIFGGGGAAGAGSLLARVGGLGSGLGGALGGSVGAAGAGTLGAGVLAAGAVGYGAGSLISKGIEGTAAGDGVGELVARTLSLFGNKEAAQAVAVNDAIKNSRVGGEIVIKVQTSDPSVPVQHQVRPLNGTQLTVRADVGRTSPEGSW